MAPHAVRRARRVFPAGRPDPPHPRRLRAVFLLAGLLPALGLGGCTRTEPPGPEESPPHEEFVPADEGMFRVVLPAGPISWNPLEGRRPFVLSLWEQLFPTLLREKSRGLRPPEFQPDLARLWDWSEERAELRLQMRTDRVWEDGAAITGADVTATYRRYLKLGKVPRRTPHPDRFGTPPAYRPSPRTWRGGGDLELRGVAAIDDSTLRFRYALGTPRWRALEIASYPILPPAAREERGPATSVPRIPSGGPFALRLSDRHPGMAALRPNPRAPAGRIPRVPGVLLEPCPGPDARVLRVVFGSADLPVYRLAGLLRGAEGYVLRRSGIASVEMLLWNLEGDSLGRDVRDGVSLAIDRDRLAALLTYGDKRYGEPAFGYLAPDSSGASGARYEPDAALRILGEAETRQGGQPRIRLIYDRGNGLREQIVTHLEEDLARVGVTLEPLALDGTEVLSRFLAGEFQVALLGFTPPETPDVSALWASWGRWNGGRYRSARTDSLVLRLLGSDDAREITRLSREIDDQIRRDVPATFLIRRSRVDLLAARVRGFDGSPASPLGRLEQVSLAAPGADDAGSEKP
jgi:ABC-type transport system substrate-binding protein